VLPFRPFPVAGFGSRTRTVRAIAVTRSTTVMTAATARVFFCAVGWCRAGAGSEAGARSDARRVAGVTDPARRRAGVLAGVGTAGAAFGAAATGTAGTPDGADGFGLPRLDATGSAMARGAGAGG
jgi:hypothetical protein